MNPSTPELIVPQMSTNLRGVREGRLAGKVAIITGGGNGIGRSMAFVFAQEGAHVTIADVDEAGATAVASEIRNRGGRANALRVDISRSDDVARMIDATVENWERLDILVNNAGIGLNRPFLETTLDEWNKTLNVVLTGTFLCSQAAARSMVQRGAGAIVNIASISGQRGAQGRTAYGVAKAGVIQLTKVMAVELAAQGVRVNAVSPGPVDTYQSRSTHTPNTRVSYYDRIPLRRYGLCEEVAAATLFLASDEARFIHGHVLNVDGGFHAAGLMFAPDEDIAPTQADSPSDTTLLGAVDPGNGGGNGGAHRSKGRSS
jgi:3-oxoacyl-[acyl-carrier protein] reductase